MNHPKMLAGVIGAPVSHSLSPYLHRYWLEELKIKGIYVGLHIEPRELTEAVRGLRSLRFVGYNVTLPHKETIIAALDSLDSVAQQVGAVNTVVIKDGQSIGYNSDVEGFVTHLERSIGAATIKKALILGAGGAVRAIVIGLKPRIETAYVVNRTPEKAARLARDFGIEACSWAEIPTILPQVDLLINGTSQGMEGQGRLEIDLSGLQPDAWVYDIVYRPLMTDLLRQAKERGLRIIDGLGMLLYQGCFGFEQWFGIRPAVTRGLREYMAKVIE